MLVFKCVAILSAFLAGGALARPNPKTVTTVSKRDWHEYDIHTDFDTVIPTGVTRQYDLTITNETSFSADGVAKEAMLINGMFPGPTIVADWGDYLEVTVHNQLQYNGTSMHWHGFRQLNSNTQDGVNGVTECPIAPGQSRTYRFQATQYGTSWYHSHFSAQYGNGVVGAMQINGPASADYDIDLGTFPITDWYYHTADEAMLIAEDSNHGPPPSDNVLFNGTNINVSGGGEGGGKYSRTTLTPGKKHRLRLINTSVENHFTVSLVGHTFTVIAMDFVPIEPVTKETLSLAIGQRYDVIIEANTQTSNSHFWFNATLAASELCGISNNPHPAAIFSYADAADLDNGLPLDPGTPVTGTCGESEPLDLVPVLPVHIPSEGFSAAVNGGSEQQQRLDVNLTTTVSVQGNSVFRWTVNAQTIDIAWDTPVLQTIHEWANSGTLGSSSYGSGGGVPKYSNHSFPAPDNVITLNQTAGEWSFWVIDNSGPELPHPIHLHGHDVFVLGQGSNGNFAANAATNFASLRFDNPTRRDVTVLPGGGWVAIAFRADNPGAWLLHCHIAWHVSQGLGVQFLERVAEIPQAMTLDHIGPQCDVWKEYAKTAPYLKLDSGL